ncbi:MAG: DUF726 domain-containing protein [Deltaproteobacteria bacterium]|nr:DUF726 domain-containing protein [Deltaproteobacteria bacterium]
MFVKKLLKVLVSPIAGPIAGPILLGMVAEHQIKKKLKHSSSPSVVERVFGAEEVFEVINLKSTGCSPTVVAVSGFMNENEDGSQWMSFLRQHFPQNQWVYIRWESGSAGSLVFSSPAWEWMAALNHSAEAGKRLAKYIEGSPGEKIVLGHSLGARTINHALKKLDKNSFSKLLAVQLFGGAVSSRCDSWRRIGTHLKCPVLNYFSSHDSVLKNLYKDKVLSSPTPAGLAPIEGFNNDYFANYDVSSKVEGHSAYYERYFPQAIHNYVSDKSPKHDVVDCDQYDDLGL